MAGLMLAINSFAWFTFVSNANNNIDVDVIKWDIEFFEDDTETSMMDINLDNLYPGMTEYVKGITIRNSSDLGAIFSYSIEDIEIFGEKYEADNLIDSLLNDFPFYIMFEAPASDLGKDETIPFRARVGWKFEQDNTYCKVKNFYPYNSTWNYYSLVGDEYVLKEFNDDSYKENTEEVFVECDDLDSYWGEKSVIYKEEHPDSSALTLKLKLMVTQKES